MNGFFSNAIFTRIFHLYFFGFFWFFFCSSDFYCQIGGQTLSGKCIEQGIFTNLNFLILFQEKFFTNVFSRVKKENLIISTHNFFEYLRTDFFIRFYWISFSQKYEKIAFLFRLLSMYIFASHKVWNACAANSLSGKTNELSLFNFRLQLLTLVIFFWKKKQHYIYKCECLF
jgi:hypothetical protein